MCYPGRDSGHVDSSVVHSTWGQGQGTAGGVLAPRSLGHRTGPPLTTHPDVWNLGQTIHGHENSCRRGGNILKFSIKFEMYIDSFTLNRLPYIRYEIHRYCSAEPPYMTGNSALRRTQPYLTVVLGAAEVHDTLDGAVVASSGCLQLHPSPQSCRELCCAHEPVCIR